MSIRFLGLRVPRAVMSGPPKPGVYLDSAATTLMAEPVERVMRAYLESGFYSNPHSKLTTPSIVTSQAIAESRGLLARLVDAPDGHVVVFGGSGATEPLNVLSRALLCDCGERDTVVVTAQEHHSNLLPWMRDSDRPVVVVPTRDDGTLDLDALDMFMGRSGDRVRIVAVTAVSNVTGVRNPIGEIADIAHRYGAQIVVDASQAVAHVPLSMRRLGIDYLVASGHKMYAPGTPGFMVIPSSVPCGDIEIGNIGGGVVDRVSLDGGVEFKTDAVERLEGGTVNVPGIIGLGAAAKMLADVGVQRLQQDEQALMARLCAGLMTIQGMKLYGPGERTSIVSFGIDGIDHNDIAAALNDYFAISVRSGAFCAHPYVRRLLGHGGGMVRASIGMYTAASDIDALLFALRWIVQNRELIAKERPAPAASFSIAKEMANAPTT